MKLNERQIELNTGYSKGYYGKAKQGIVCYEADSQKDVRLQKMYCKSCHYLKSGNIAGHAFTNYTCRNCDKVAIYHNTSVPRYCKKCSDTYQCCIRCGAKV